jgi:type IV pilus assembly protein PilY1
MRYVIAIVACLVCLCPGIAPCFAAEPSLADYTAYPTFLVSFVKPNVLVLLDNSGSMFYFAYDFNGSSVSTGFNPSATYYGYFDATKWYTYQTSNSRFEATGSKTERGKNPSEWDGNFLNWLTMRRVDITKKVLVGGKCVARTASPPTYDLVGEQADGTSRGYQKRVSSASTYTPYSGTRCFTFNYGASGTSLFKVGTASDGTCPSPSCSSCDTRYVRVYQSEEPKGVIQSANDKVRWGLEFYNDEQGGYIATPIGESNAANIVSAVEAEQPSTWTPLAESLWTATGYFSQSTTTGSNGPRYASGDYTVSAATDPFNFGTGASPNYVPCAKSFVITITDGEPTKDRNLPSGIKGYYPSYTDGTEYVPSWAGPNPPNYFWYDPNYGSHYIDDIALYAHVDVSGKRYRDLRGDLSGTQNLTFYFLYAAFGNASPDGRRLLKQAARNGGFEDMNGNFLPDLAQEYDSDGDGVPDTYFEAQDGQELENSLISSITEILRRTSSGTAVSILSTSAHGEGSLFQAYFKPYDISSVGSQIREMSWFGFLQGFWVDDRGNIREDNGDLKLVYEQDDIISFYYDPDNGTRARRDLVSQDHPYGDGVWDETNIPLAAVRSLWEAGRKLALRDIASLPRSMYTSLDGHTMVSFDPDEAATFKNYLRASSTGQAQSIMRFILGQEVSGLRSRRFFVDTNGDSVPDTEGIWRLGDIVYSTPAVVSRPMENYDEIYSDPTYGAFEAKYSRGTAASPIPRPTTVYVGANDGMLHAFNAGCYRPGDDAGTEAVKEHGRYTGEYPDYYLAALGHAPQIGEEIWTYIPGNLLPHLRFLADQSYTHVYYVDLTPKVVDARIFTPDETHPYGWGTVLIGGLRLGGGTYAVDDFDMDGTAGDPKTFSSCYFALDITNPASPRLLWEFSDSEHLGFTTCYPAVARTGDRDSAGSWYAVFGSGPTNYDGESTRPASLYVLDLRSGTLLRRFELDANGFIGGLGSLDLNLDYNVNAVYAGASYKAAGIWKGKMYRLLVGTPTGGYNDPNGWTYSVLASTKDYQAITTPPGMASDQDGTPWVYWGTGRSFSTADKTDTHTQSFYGVKDRTLQAGEPAESKIPAQLIDASNVVVTYGTPSTVTGSGLVPGGSTWDEFLSAMRGTQGTPTYGWFLDLSDIAGLNAGERVLEKPSIYGGLVMFTSFKPNSDICGYGGQGRLYGLYYETGTPYKLGVFSLVQPEPGSAIPRSIDLGEGRASSLAIHIGQEVGGKIYVQQSTGEITSVTLNPPFSQKSGSVMWYRR